MNFANGGGDVAFERPGEDLDAFRMDEEIAIPGFNQEILLPTANLPPANVLIERFEAARVSLEFWNQIAVLYYKQGRFEDFAAFLDRAVQKEGDERTRLRTVDMLAHYFTERGRAEFDEDRRKDWFQRAMAHYAAADQILRFDLGHLVGRAYFCLLQGKSDQEAEAQLNFVLEQPNVNDDLKILIPALIGKGMILYRRSDWKASLACFRKCLASTLNCPVIVRLAMGYCFSKLGMVEKAKIAFERTVELFPNNLDALTALSVIYMTHSKQQEDRLTGARTMTQLYKRDPCNPMILNHLANHFFLKALNEPPAEKAKILEKAKKLAEKSLSLSRNSQTLGEANFHVARIHHVLNEVAEAHRHYQVSMQQSPPKFLPPVFGNAQTSLLSKDYETAINLLEKILHTHPENVDALKVAGALYARSAALAATDKTLRKERQQKARTYLQKVVDMHPDETEVIVDLTVLLQRIEPAEALKLYKRVLELFNKIEWVAPPQVLNNMGVLEYGLKDFAAAKESFLKCRSSLMTLEMNEDHEKASMITVLFNLARTYEKLGRMEQAKSIYEALIQKVPKYSDARFRLGCVHYKQNETESAKACFKELLQLDPHNPDPWIMLGCIHFDQGDLLAAQKDFDAVRELRDCKNDPIALVGIGNMWLRMLTKPKLDRKPGDDEKYRERAAEFFSKALRTEPRCFNAANGLGCVLAYKGEHASALDVFVQVRESNSDYADVWLNLANLQLDSGNNSQASFMYESYVHRFPVQQFGDFCTNAAYAHYRSGQHQKALDWLDRLVAHDPADHQVRYNHAFVSMEFASKTFGNENTKAADMQHAMEMLEAAREIFRELSELPLRFIEPSLCTKLVGKCDDLVLQGRQHLQRAIMADEDEARRTAALNEQRLLKQEQLKIEELIKAEAKKLELDQMKIKRNEYKLRMKDAVKPVEVQDEPAPRRRAEGGGGGRKRKKQARDSDGFVNDSDEEPNRLMTKKKKALVAKQNRKKDRDFIDDGESGDEKRRRRRKKGVEEVEEEPGRLKGKVKSAAFIDSSGSSSSDSDGEKPSTSTAARGTLQAPITANAFGSSDEDEEEPKPKAKKNARKVRSSSSSGSESDDVDLNKAAVKKAAALAASSDEEEDEQAANPRAAARPADSDDDEDSD